MLEIRFRRDSRQRLSSVLADGHAGWAEDGEDIVCAAASAILQAAWMGLAEHAKVDVSAERDKGRLSLSWPETVRDRDDVVAIVATAELALTQIARQYETHVRVRSEPEPETRAPKAGISTDKGEQSPP